MLRLTDDKDYQDEAQKTIGEPIEYGSSATLNDEVRKALTITPELRAFMADYIKKGSRE